MGHRNRHMNVSLFNHLYLLPLTKLAGIFKLELFLPDDYPMTPPKIRFLTKIYHPNIDKLGRICLDVLKSMYAFSIQYNISLSLYRDRQLVSGITDTHHLAFYTGPTWRSQPGRPFGQRCGTTLERG